MHLRIWWKEEVVVETKLFKDKTKTITNTGIVCGSDGFGESLFIVRKDDGTLVDYVLLDDVTKSEWVEKP